MLRIFPSASKTPLATSPDLLEWHTPKHCRQKLGEVVHKGQGSWCLELSLQTEPIRGSVRLMEKMGVATNADLVRYSAEHQLLFH